jgi:PAS domain S-box-containing protein
VFPRGRDAEEIVRGLFDQSVAGIYVLELTGAIVSINARFAELFGLTQEEMIGRPYFDFVPVDEIDKRRTAFERLARGELESRQVLGTFVRANGEQFELLTQSSLADFEGKPVVIGVGADVTERSRIRHALERTNSALRTLSLANSALNRAQTETELLQEMCDVALAFGNYSTAWVGVAEHDADKTVRPVAAAGVVLPESERLAIRWDDSPFGQGPTGTAIRTGRPVVFRTRRDADKLQAWTTIIAAIGNEAFIALPLTDPTGTFGTLGLYSPDPNAFDDDEVEVLTQLASDISFGMTALRNRTALHDAEARARGHSRRLEGLWRIVNNPRLTGAALWSAMLSEASATIRPGHPYLGVLLRVDGSEMLVEALANTPEYEAPDRSLGALAVGTRFPIANTAAGLVLALGLGTHTWDDFQADFSKDRIRRFRWRSALATAFETGPSTFLLFFASTDGTGAWDEHDRAYVEIMARSSRTRPSCVGSSTAFATSRRTTRSPARSTARNFARRRGWRQPRANATRWSWST